MLTEEQIAEFKKACSEFDKDGDGVIFLHELGNVLTSLGIKPTAELHDIISDINAEGKGTIAFADFLTKMLEVKPESDFLRSEFQKFDKDGNGFLTAAEVRQVISSLGVKIKDEEIQVMIKESDVDGDGRVNYEEFIKHITGR